MTMNELLQMALTGLKFLATRKSVKRKEEAAAEMADVEVEDAQLTNLRKHVDWLQEQLAKKEERFAEQTDLVRKLQAEVLRLTKAEATLRAERKLKLCERRNCEQRVPQSGY